MYIYTIVSICMHILSPMKYPMCFLCIIGKCIHRFQFRMNWNYLFAVSRHTNAHNNKVIKGIQRLEHCFGCVLQVVVLLNLLSSVKLCDAEPVSQTLLKDLIVLLRCFSTLHSNSGALRGHRVLPHLSDSLRLRVLNVKFIFFSKVRKPQRSAESSWLGFALS